MDDETSEAFRRTDTAERPAVVVPPEPAQPISPVVPTTPPPRPPSRDRPPAPAWIAWAVVAIVLAVAAMTGGWLVVQPPESPTALDPSRSASGTVVEPTPVTEESEDPAGDSGEDDEPDEDPSPDDDAGGSTEPVAIGGLATAEVPGAAPPNNDVTGERVTFSGDNMLDGDPASCWRIAGDATGQVLTFRFDTEMTITQVAMVNGYAKTSVDSSGRGFDWYHGNRRVARVEWLVGDRVFPQELGEFLDLQVIDIKPTETTEIGLRLVEVTPPGAGPTGRDYTAISDVAFSGFES